MWETMGPIADRSAERLGASDVAIVEFRRMMVDAVRRHMAGEPRSARLAAALRTSRYNRSKASCRKGSDWTTMPDPAKQEPAEEHR